MIRPIFEIKLLPKDKELPEIIYVFMRLDVPTLEDALQYVEKHYPTLIVDTVIQGYRQVT